MNIKQGPLLEIKITSLYAVHVRRILNLVPWKKYLRTRGLKRESEQKAKAVWIQTKPEVCAVLFNVQLLRE